MKKIMLPLLLLAVMSNAATAQKKGTNAKSGIPAPQSAPGSNAQPASLAIGARIPNDGMPMMGVDNKPISFMQAKGENGLLIMFSCNTCPYVVKAQPQTDEVMHLATSLHVGMVIINSNEAQRGDEDSPDAMRRYAEAHKYTVPYVRDDGSMMANIFGATRTPEVFLFNADGKLVYKGALEDNPAEPAKSKQFYLADAIKALASKKPIKVAETKSIGCSIKRMM